METATTFTIEPGIEPSSVTADTINAAHGRVLGLAHGMIRAGNAFVLAAAECGEQLMAKKAEVGHGHWLPWLAQNCPLIHVTTATDYMTLGRNKGRVLNMEGVDSIRHALRLLTEKEQKGDDKPTVEKLPFKLSLSFNGVPESWEPVKQRALFNQSKPLLEALQSLGFIEIKAVNP